MSALQLFSHPSTRRQRLRHQYRLEVFPQVGCPWCNIALLQEVQSCMVSQSLHCDLRPYPDDSQTIIISTTNNSSVC